MLSMSVVLTKRVSSDSKHTAVGAMLFYTHACLGMLAFFVLAIRHGPTEEGRSCDTFNIPV